MNERFRELTQLAVEDAAKYCQRPFDLSREENETFAMSFAELIVRECVRISRTSADGFSAGRRMEEHFGVENA